MGRTIFLFQNVWKQIIYNKFMSIVMLGTMIIGFLFPLLALNDVNDLLADARMGTGADASHMAVIDYLMQYKDEAQMYEIINRGREKGLFTEAGFSAFGGEIIYVGDESYSWAVNGVSEEYLNLSACELLSGKMFSKEDYAGVGGRVCLLSHQSSLMKNGIGPGDTIQILGNTYTIKGVIRAPRIFGGIFIPYAITSDIFSGGSSQIQCQIITYGENEPNPKLISPKLLPGELLVFALTGVEREEIYHESVGKVNSYRILRAAAVIGFAIVNFLILMSGKVIHERHYMAIRMALGASGGAITAEVVAMNLLIMSAAFTIDLILYAPVAGLVSRSNIYLQAPTILQVLAGGAPIVAITGIISYHIGLRKQRIALLLKKQG